MGALKASSKLVLYRLAVFLSLSVALFSYPEFEEPRHTLASSRRKTKENPGDLLLFCHKT
jgi:hypothetical protein